MSRQFQYQGRFIPLADPVAPVVPTGYGAIYPDIIPKKRRSPFSEAEIGLVPDFPPFTSAVYPDYILKKRRSPPSEAEENFLAVLPQIFFGSVYPDGSFKKKKFTIAEPEYSVFTPAPVIPVAFGANYPDIVGRNRERNQIARVTFFTYTDIVAPNFDKYQEPPDFLFKRAKAYSDLKSSFPSGFVPAFFTGNYHSLIEFYNLKIRLDVKKAVDSGQISALSTDPSGTTVTFNRAFKDVESIVGTVQETTDFSVVIDFVDIPNPTTFKVYVFNTSGVRVSKTVYWVARGII